MLWICVKSQECTSPSKTNSAYKFMCISVFVGVCLFFPFLRTLFSECEAAEGPSPSRPSSCPSGHLSDKPANIQLSERFVEHLLYSNKCYSKEHVSPLDKLQALKKTAFL